MKVGVFGTGGAGKGTIKNLATNPLVSGIVAYDVVEDQLRSLPPTDRVTTTARLEDVLGDPDVKLVFVKTSNHAHRDLTIQSLEAGKAVLCEKPMANTLADAREMVETAERLGLFLQIGFELRYSHLYTKVKEWAAAGLLGDIVNTHCMYCSSAYKKGAWRNRKDVGGGTFGERLSHYVDLTRWWVDAPVVDVFSACAPNVVPYTEVRDNYHTTYRFDNGAVGHISYYQNYPATFRGDALSGSVTDLQQGDGHKLHYTIVGTRGAAEADVFRRSLKRWEFSAEPDVMASDWVENLTWTPEEDHAYYHNGTDQTFDIVRRVAEGLPPMTPARDAYETMRLCHAAEESADTGRSVRLEEM